MKGLLFKEWITLSLWNRNFNEVWVISNLHKMLSTTQIFASKAKSAGSQVKRENACVILIWISIPWYPNSWMALNYHVPLNFFLNCLNSFIIVPQSTFNQWWCVGVGEDSAPPYSCLVSYLSVICNIKFYSIINNTFYGNRRIFSDIWLFPN